MKSLDQYWYDRNLIAWLLWPLSLVFCALVFVRRSFYKSGFFKSVGFNIPVVIVGNISVGGTGKTPLITKLVELLESWGYRTGVISRGYGGQGPWPYHLSKESQAAESGDEPLQIFKRTGCPIVVGPDRIQDIAVLLQNHELDLVLCDDGLQHYRLQRDLELIVVDAQRQFGNRFCLPAGPLREPVSRARNADWVIQNGGDSDYSFSIQSGKVIRLMNRQELNFSDFAATKVHAVAGIGNPQRFFNLLRTAGLDIIEHAFPDHHNFIQQELEFSDEWPVLMTEKDSVKCSHFSLNNLWYVPVDIKLSDTFLTDFKRKISELTRG